MLAFLACGVLATVLVVLATVVLSGINAVRDGTQVVVERFGKFSRLLSPGLNFIWPLENARRVRWYDSAARTTFSGPQIPTRECLFDPPEVVVTTADRIQISFDVSMRYAIANVQHAVYAVDDLYGAMRDVIDVAITGACAGRTLDAIMADQTAVTDAIRQRFAADSAGWGIRVIGVSLQRVKLPKNIYDAGERALAAATAIRVQREQRAQEHQSGMEIQRHDAELAAARRKNATAESEHDAQMRKRAAESARVCAEIDAAAEELRRRPKQHQLRERIDAFSKAGADIAAYELAKSFGKLGKSGATVVLPPEALRMQTRSVTRGGQ